MKVLAIMPDSLTNPTGGLGVQFKELHSRLKDKIELYVVSQPEPEVIDKHLGVLHPLPYISHGGISTLIGNTAYLAAALKFPKPDIVHATDWSVYLAGVYLAEHYGVPLVCSMNLSPSAMESSCGIFNCINSSAKDGMWLHKTAVEMEHFLSLIHI